MNVLDAAITRVRNVFKNDCKIYLSFSSGKDSLCMASIVYDLIRAGEIDGTKLTVTFIDEEGLYPSMVEAAHRWRRNFLSVGAKFLWFCLPFKQVSVIDHLSSSESWITWEPGKEDVWMRKPPDFAIMYSPYLHYPGEMNYQTFCGKAFADGIQLVGLRTAESLTRLKCIANAKMERIVRGGKFYPIYDWRDSDVWLYIKQRNLEFPEIYMRLYEAGVRKNALRTKLGGKVPCVIVDHHGDESADVYGTITHNRARGTHLLEPMKAIVKKLMDEGKTVEEIGKQLGMKPEEVFRLSGFTRDEFLELMTKDHPVYSKARVIRSV